MTESEFVSDAKTTAAVEREITIMGEAVTKISVEFKNASPEVPWGRIVKLRNFYIHAYERLTPEEVWRTANRLIPRVGRLVVDLMSDEEEA